MHASWLHTDLSGQIETYSSVAARLPEAGCSGCILAGACISSYLPARSNSADQLNAHARFNAFCSEMFAFMGTALPVTVLLFLELRHGDCAVTP